MSGSVVSANVSASSGAGLAQLLKQIEGAAAHRFELTEDLGVTRQRHAECVSTCATHIAAALTLVGQEDAELLAEELRLAARALARIGGRIDVEDVLDRIFGEFCIGK